jgi:hypothetical protein
MIARGANPEQRRHMRYAPAERLRDSLLAMFPQMGWCDDDERVRRWRLRGSALVGVVELRAEVLAAVDAVPPDCAARGEADRAALLRDAGTTLRALMRRPGVSVQSSPAAQRAATPPGCRAESWRRGRALRPPRRSRLSTVGGTGRAVWCESMATNSPPAPTAQVPYAARPAAAHRRDGAATADPRPVRRAPARVGR